MARRTVQVRIADDNRDKGKVFLLTEMDAERAEDWGMRALLALTAAGAEIPDDFEGAGMAGIAAMGVQALQGLRYDDVKPLWSEMMECVQIIPDPARSEVVRGLVADDIEEISTRLRLRKEIVELHVNFSRLASLSKSASAETNHFLGGGVITRTSPAPSAP